ncbi:retrovirus-related pol polyprotein from transposon TNT 1-94 [Tanacetum coccineum]
MELRSKDGQLKLDNYMVNQCNFRTFRTKPAFSGQPQGRSIAWVKCVWGDNNVEKVTENINGTYERNVEQCSIQIGSTTIPKEVIVTNSPTSYAKLVTGESSRKSVNFHTLIASAGKGTDVAISVESVRAITERFANTVYGFFLGKQMAYSLVSKDGMDSMLENCPWFIRNNPFILKQWNLDVNLWNGFNVYNVMVYGFFLGKPMVYSVFGSKDGMDSMIENGPWFIRNNPFILKQWNPDVNLLKEDVCNVMVLGKFHGVPMTSLSDDELSAIATNLLRADVGWLCLNLLVRGSICLLFVLSRSGNLPCVRVAKKPLLKVVSTTNVDSDSKVENEVDDHAVFMASTGLKRGADSGYGTNTLLEQWRTTKHDDYDPYDDDLYETNVRGSGNSVWEKGPSMDDDPDMGNGGEASGSVTSNMGNSPSPAVNVPQFSGEGFTTSTIHVEYEWAPPRCSECKVFRHVLDDCPKKIFSDISKNSNMSLQPARGPLVGWKPKYALGYSQTSKEIMRIEESLNVTFDESLPMPKSSPSIEDDGIDEPIVQDLNGSPSLQVNVSDEGYPKSFKEARGHPIKQVVSELNKRTLRLR